MTSTPLQVVANISYSICGVFKLAVGVSLPTTEPQSRISADIERLIFLPACLCLKPYFRDCADICSQAAGQFQKVEDAIFEALVEIPETMESAQRYIQIYSEMQESLLEKRTFDLFWAVLKALIHIMRFFADSSIRNEPSFQVL